MRFEGRHRGKEVASAADCAAAMLAKLQNCYMIDLVCDEDVVDFYEQCGGRRLHGVGWRNYEQLRNPP